MLFVDGTRVTDAGLKELQKRSQIARLAACRLPRRTTFVAMSADGKSRFLPHPNVVDQESNGEFGVAGVAAGLSADRWVEDEILRRLRQRGLRVRRGLARNRATLLKPTRWPATRPEQS